MKKILLTLCFFALFQNNFSVFAQEFFTLTPDGFISKDDKKYVVIESKGSMSEILSRLQRAIQNTFTVDNDNCLIVNDNQIIISSFKLDLFRIKAGLLMESILDLDYTIKFTIKDGRYKIDSPILKNIGVHRFMIPTMQIYANPKDYKDLKKKQFIFDYDSREVNNQEAKSAIEDYINGVLSDVVKAVDSNDTEEW